LPYIDPDDPSTHYRTLDDLILDLVDKPDQLFLRDNGCEALVYVEELDQILLLDCHELQNCSDEVCHQALRNKLAAIRRALH
jgi:hypothetical protein